MTQPSDDEELNVLRFSVLALSLSLQMQMEGIRDASSTLAAAFNAARQSKRVEKTLHHAAKDLGVTRAEGESPVTTIEKIRDAADAKGINTECLTALLPDLKAIAAEVEKQQAGFLKTTRIARKYLRANPRP